MNNDALSNLRFGPQITGRSLRLDEKTQLIGGRTMEMASLKTICQIYDWKYDTIYKKWKRGEFVRGYRDPVGRGIRFDLKDVAEWAHQSPVEIPRPSLLVNEL